MRVLIACPIADKLLMPTMRKIIELDTTGCARADIVFLQAAPDPHVDARDAIAAQYNEARRLTLDGSLSSSRRINKSGSAVPCASARAAQ